MILVSTRAEQGAQSLRSPARGQPVFSRLKATCQGAHQSRARSAIHLLFTTSNQPASPTVGQTFRPILGWNVISRKCTPTLPNFCVDKTRDAVIVRADRCIDVGTARTGDAGARVPQRYSAQPRCIPISANAFTLAGKKTPGHINFVSLAACVDRALHTSLAFTRARSAAYGSRICTRICWLLRCPLGRAATECWMAEATIGKHRWDASTRRTTPGQVAQMTSLDTATFLEICL